jgi:FMN phosphatase YigB (HAD superfamily)
MYRWSSWDREWLATKAEADLAHGELNDSDWEVVDDHDARYYPRNDLDTYHNDIDERLELLESLNQKTQNLCLAILV